MGYVGFGSTRQAGSCGFWWWLRVCSHRSVVVWAGLEGAVLPPPVSPHLGQEWLMSYSPCCSWAACLSGVLPFSAEIPGSCPPGMPGGVGSERICEEVTPCSWQPCSLLSRHFLCSVGHLAAEWVFQLCSWAGHRAFHADTRRADLSM